jgi:hypothetical protein
MLCAHRGIARCRVPSAARHSGRAGVRLAPWLHSRYERRLTDLTVSGKDIVVHLRGRRFFCGTDSCGRRTFVEQVAPSRLTVKHGRRRVSRPGTSEDRLALGGCAGACMTRHLVTAALGGGLQELPGGVDAADRGVSGGVRTPRPGGVFPDFWTPIYAAISLMFLYPSSHS